MPTSVKNALKCILIFIMLGQGFSIYCQEQSPLHMDMGTIARSTETAGGTPNSLGEGIASFIIDGEKPDQTSNWGDRSPEELRRLAHQLLQSGDSAASQGERQVALEAFAQSTYLFKYLADTVAVASGLKKMGNQHYYLKDYQTAIQNYRTSLAYWILLEDASQQAALWFNLALAYRFNSQDKESEFCYRQALDFCTKGACKPLKQLKYLNSLANMYLKQLRYMEADSVLEMGVSVQASLPDSLQQPLTFELAGNSQFFQGNMVRAFELYTESLQLSEQLDLANHIGINLHNIGLVLRSVENYDEAITYFKEALVLRREIAHSEGIASTLSAMGALYIDIDKCEKAKGYFMEALDIAKGTGDKEQLTFIYQNLGEICFELNDLDLAEDYLSKAIQLGRETNNALRIYESQFLLGILLSQHGKWIKAEKLWLEVQAWGIANKQYLLVRNVSEQLSGLYANKRQYQQAYLYRTYEVQYTDSLQTFQAQQQIVKQNFEFRLNRVKAYEELRQQKQSQIYQGQINRQRNHKYFFIVAFGLASLLAFFIYRNFRIKNQVNEMLEEKNRLISAQKEEIMDLNQSLERKVTERTKELEKRNVQLREYAFMNSHRVRGPLANILGVFRLREEDGFDSQEEEREFFDMAAQSAKEMDNIIQLMNDKLNEEPDSDHA